MKKASGDPNFSRRRHWPLTYLQPISRIHAYNTLTSCLRLFAITFPARFKWLRFRYSYIPRHARGVYLFSIKDPDVYVLRAFLRSGNVFVPAQFPENEKLRILFNNSILLFVIEKMRRCIVGTYLDRCSKVRRFFQHSWFTNENRRKGNVFTVYTSSR